jgi:hypothetical protein
MAHTCTVSIMQSAAASRSLLLSAFSSCVVTQVLLRPRFSNTRNALQQHNMPRSV